jgi:hypothetical protein
MQETKEKNPQKWELSYTLVLLANFIYILTFYLLMRYYN